MWPEDKEQAIDFPVSALLFKVLCEDSLAIIYTQFILYLLKDVDLVLHLKRHLNKLLILIYSPIFTLIH